MRSKIVALVALAGLGLAIFIWPTKSTVIGDRVDSEGSSRSPFSKGDEDSVDRDSAISVLSDKGSGPSFHGDGSLPPRFFGLKKKKGEAQSGDNSSAPSGEVSSSPTASSNFPTPNPETVQTEATSSPEIDALRDVERLAAEQNNHLIGGNRSGLSAAIQRKSGKATVTLTPALPVVGGQARGFTMLYLMHPHARGSVEAGVSTLLRAQLDTAYLGVLIDGTFSLDYDYLNSVITRLSEGGMGLTLVLYLSNGPTMREWSSTPIDAAFNRINPTDFRWKIQNDTLIREEFKSRVGATLPTLDLNSSFGAKHTNILIPMLEDNLDASSYRAMRSLAGELVGERGRFIRNPCVGCWAGNDSGGQGDSIEIHAPADILELHSGDGYSLDGAGYFFPWESQSRNRLSIDEVKGLATSSVPLGVSYFGLWRFERQGLLAGKIDPNLRNYEISDDRQQEIEIELLRSGLSEAIN